MIHAYTQYSIYEAKQIIKEYGLNGTFDILDRDQFIMKLKLTMPQEEYVMRKLDGSLQVCLDKILLHMPATWHIEIILQGDHE